MVDLDDFDGLVVLFEVAILASMRLYAAVCAQDLACYRANEVSQPCLPKVFVAFGVCAAGKSIPRMFSPFSFRILVGFLV